ncbi:MAG: hypothetical protein KAJ69_01425 [Thermoplasmatales archaeon]|nr:hypothetical protein [Thermoplasmatales archaeon]
MLRIKLKRNIISLTVSILLVLLLFSTIFPPFSAVKLKPGTPSDTSIDLYNTIIFDNVNLTIRGPERIPVSFLNFTIFEGSTEIAYVKFNVTGSEMEDSPSNKFTVTNITDTSSLPYDSSGSYYGYDEDDGSNHTFGYGYGYASSSASDLIILYRITYTAHQTGDFTAKLFVNSSNYTYVSGPSLTFTVSEGEISNPYPAYESIGISRPPTNLSVKINGTNLDAYFYLYNMTPVTDTWTRFANWTNVSTQRCEFTNFTDMDNDWMWGNTSYQWSVNATNGSTWSNTSYYYTTTGTRYDVSNNEIVNVQDLSYTFGYFSTGSKPYDGLYDVNDNGAINVQDLSFIWNNRT